MALEKIFRIQKVQKIVDNKAEEVKYFFTIQNEWSEYLTHEELVKLYKEIIRCLPNL